MKLYKILLIAFFLNPWLIRADLRAQHEEISGSEAPLVGPAKLTAKNAGWSFLVPLPVMEKSTVLISARDNRIRLRVVFRNPHFIHEIWIKDDSTVEIKMTYCPPRDCGQADQLEKVIIPKEFDLRVLYNDDTAQARVAYVSNNLSVTETKGSSFIEFQLAKGWAEPTWCFIWQGGITINSLQQIYDWLESAGKILVIESGWYDGLPAPIIKSTKMLNRKERIYYDCLYGAEEYILVFFRPNSETASLMPNVLKELESRWPAREGALIYQVLGG